MNVNAIRVYTLHPPSFYEALLEYNSQAAHPIYLFHGVWVDEEAMVASKDAFAGTTSDDFKKEMKDAVDVIHGQANLPSGQGMPPAHTKRMSLLMLSAGSWALSGILRQLILLINNIKAWRTITGDFFGQNMHSLSKFGWLTN